MINTILSNPTAIVPVVGMGASVCRWSDRDPATIIEVLTFKTGPKAGQVKGVVIQQDLWTVVKGSEGDGSAEYTYEADTDAMKETFLITSDGRYLRKGDKYTRLTLMTRERYYDPSF